MSAIVKYSQNYSEMEQSLLNSVISVDCGPQGYYQGKLHAIDVEGNSRSLTLTSAFKEGIPIRETVKISGSDILKIKVLRTPSENVGTASPPKTVQSRNENKKSREGFNQVKEKNFGVGTSVQHGQYKNSNNVNTGPQRSYADNFQSSTQNQMPKQQSQPQTRKNPKSKAYSANRRRVDHLVNLSSDSESDTTGTDIIGGSKKYWERDDSQSSSMASSVESDPVSSMKFGVGANKTKQSGETMPNEKKAGKNERNELFNRREFGRKNKQLPSANANDLAVAGAPNFRLFEPQVPKPCQLPSVNAMHRKGKGPTGMPLVDAENGYCRYRDTLGGPIKPHELSEDFDFEASNMLFTNKPEDKQLSDDRYYEQVEKSKMSRNFAHDENIVNDPSRVTSWTTMLAMGKAPSTSPDLAQLGIGVSSGGNKLSVVFNPSDSEKTSHGVILPVLDEVIKAKYLEECLSLLGEEVFDAIVADRLLSYILNVIKKCDLSVTEVVVIPSRKTSNGLIRRLCTHVDNRRCKVIVYGRQMHMSSARVHSVPDVSRLPSQCQLCVVLGSEISPRVEDWLVSLKTTHVIGLETKPKRIPANKLHVMMLGVLTAGVYRMSSEMSQEPMLGKTSFAQLCGQPAHDTKIDAVICDVGVPFAWVLEFEDRLALAFADQLLVHL